MGHYEDRKHQIAFICLAGSRAYGLETPESDHDIRGVYVPPSVELFGLSTPPEDLIHKDVEGHREFQIWELGKFVKLAVKANPNIIETLWTQEHLVLSVFKPFIKHRKVFLSKEIGKTYLGYARSQFHKMQQDVNQRGDIRWKHAMHLLRLLHAGTIALQIEAVPVKIGGALASRLKDIRHGRVPFDQVMAEYERYEDAFKNSWERSKLPEYPDTAFIDDMLKNARLEALDRPPKNDWKI